MTLTGKLSSGRLLLSKAAFGPLLKWQGKRLRASMTQLEEAAGARLGSFGEPAAGPPLRLLVVGDSSAAGVGVERQEHALAAQTAGSLAAYTGQRVEWQMAARIGRTAASLRTMLADTKLAPADVLVCCLGANEVLRQTRPREFISSYRALLAELVPRIGARIVVVNGLPPMHIQPSVPQPLRWYLGQCAFRLDRALRAWTGSEGLEYVSLGWAATASRLGADKFHPGRGQYAEWGRIVAARVAARLQRK